MKKTKQSVSVYDTFHDIIFMVSSVLMILFFVASCADIDPSQDVNSGQSVAYDDQTGMLTDDAKSPGAVKEKDKEKPKKKQKKKAKKKGDKKAEKKGDKKYENNEDKKDKVGAKDKLDCANNPKYLVSISGKCLNAKKIAKSLKKSSPDVKQLHDACNNKGYLIKDRCFCENPYFGEKCETNGDDWCNGKGKMVYHRPTNERRCGCDDDYMGPLCNTNKRDYCNGRGTGAVDPKTGRFLCESCDDRYYGKRCEFNIQDHGCQSGLSFMADDGCNTCFCTEKNDIGCTEMFCPEHSNNSCYENKGCMMSQYHSPIGSDDDCYCPHCSETPLSRNEHKFRETQWKAYCSDWKSKTPCAVVRCSKPPDTHCSKRTCGADQPGKCVSRPQACTKEYRPVCGCDGKTYSNKCVAYAAGQNILHEKECTACVPGTSFKHEDGCNTCTCQRDGLIVCTLRYCPKRCKNHLDCNDNDSCTKDYCHLALCDEPQCLSGDGG